MIRGLDTLTINSANANELANFYQDKVGVKIKEEYEMGEGARAFEMDTGEGSSFFITAHSEVQGKSKDPMRIVFNFEVDDIDKAIAEVTGKGVKTIAEKYHIEGYGYVATFEDLDGNHFQLVQVRA
jgi:predicted enzyme related to lactoylglutathione lyase